MRGANAARVAIVALSLVVLWRVLEVNAVLYEADGRPRFAPVAGSDREVLEAALRENPSLVAAMLVLAADGERQGDRSRAAALYDAARHLAPIDRNVLEAAAGFAFRSGHRDQGIALIGTLIEHYGEARDRAFPALAASLATRADAAAWSALVANDPAWLGAFVISSCRRGVDPLLLAPLVERRSSRGADTAEESACLVDRLRLADRWPEAYQVWLNSLPRGRLREVGFIYNGAFEYAPAQSGFDWIEDRRAERESGHVVERAIAVGVKGPHVLRVTYTGRRQNGVPISQYLALASGSYELAGWGKPEGLTVGRGIQWTVRCVKEGIPRAIIASSERFVGSSEWRPFSFEVTVPAQCPGQVLQLELAGADEGAAYANGIASFDDLALRRRSR